MRAIILNIGLLSLASFSLGATIRLERNRTCTNDCRPIHNLENQGPSDAYFKYNFNLAVNPSPGGGTDRGGSGVLANQKNFPALIGLGVAASVGFLNPCGMNTPHTHPRATEFLIIVSGSNVKTGFIQGGREYRAHDYLGSPVVFIAASSSDDLNLSRTTQDFFRLNPGIVDADLGLLSFLDHINIAQFAATIPPAFALAANSCLDRCGIKY
ncbi:hypothetical protein BDZ45DRAFT_749583 [Acephala macrosclerotiorum]|nr:hypothetical protein BDZ45DRAFT_749583 [Acephala macrosclerotiorum]